MTDHADHPSKDVNQTAPSVDKSEAKVKMQPTGIPGKTDTAADGGEIREQLAAIYRVKMGQPIFPPLLDELEHLIASRLSALLSGLEEEGPEDKDLNVFDQSEFDNYCGVNETNDQWRALLAKARSQL